MIEHLFWAILFLACLALGVWEISRWFDRDLATVITTPHKARRAIGLALTLCIATVGYRIASFPKHGISKAQAADQVLMGMAIMLMVVALVGVAYYEWKATLVEFSAARKEAIVETISDLPASVVEASTVDE